MINIRHIIKIIIYSDYRKLYLLNKKSRYKEGTINIGNILYKYLDAPSFYSIYQEVFIKKKLFFNIDTDSPFIIDCGANIGLTVLYFKKIFPDAKILAFEPDPKCFQVCKENIYNQNIKNVTIENVALSDFVGESLFYLEGADAGRIESMENTTPIKIKTTILSTYITEKVNFLKIDIEGEEVKVIMEIENKLHFVERIFIEYHSFCKTSQQLSIILDILERNNFRYYIEQNCVWSEFPYIAIKSYLGMDLLLNIFATKMNLQNEQ